LRAAAQEYGINTVSVPLGNKFHEEQAVAALNASDKLIHLAGVNRGSDREVIEGNSIFVTQLSTALKKVDTYPQEIVYANSIQSGNGSVYGTAKAQVDKDLTAIASRIGAAYTNIVLPNLFGEYGKPFYNSVIATFSHLISIGERPQIDEDRELQLLHAQNAADILLGKVPRDSMNGLSTWETVSGVKRLLEEFSEHYTLGEFPDISTSFRRDLFNTYRAYTFPAHTPINITRHADQRGSFFEIVRARGGTGQTSFSTTAPGITRGDHYHRRKVERFTILSGEAEISLRRLFDDKIFTYRISGDEPKSVDMPTLYSHKIKNVGSEMLYTAFWTNDIFDPIDPDTVAELV
jgi:UDP-2-acetamido-2,6-beta-L-arabino-hexul-4-ose reductase